MEPSAKVKVIEAVDAALPTLPALPSEGELIALAEAASPVLQRALLDQQIAALEVKKARGAYFPIVGLQATAVEQKTTFPSDGFQQISLLARIPLFTGGETGARVDGARERARQADLAVTATRRSLKEAVRTALLELETARSTVALASQRLDVARAEYEQTYSLYEAQEATSLDLDSSEIALAAARRDLISAQARALLADLALRATASQLKTPLLGKETP